MGFYISSGLILITFAQSAAIMKREDSDNSNVSNFFLFRFASADASHAILKTINRFSRRKEVRFVLNALTFLFCHKQHKVCHFFSLSRAGQNRAGTVQETLHRRSRLPHDGRVAPQALRAMGRDSRRGGDEGPEDEAVARLRLHHVLEGPHGGRRAERAPSPGRRSGR